MKGSIGFVICICLLGCAPKALLPVFEFEKPFDTTDRPIDVQVKKVFDDDSLVFADNLFGGARLNGFERNSDTSFLITILPENEPINPSPWYAFRIWSKVDQDLTLYFDYGKYKHRYYPKWSDDGSVWENLDSSRVVLDTAGVFQHMEVELKASDTLWIAGQEVIASRHVRGWAQQLATNPGVALIDIGTSKQGRDIQALDINRTARKKSPMLVVLSRQHPPEVTGYNAMTYFIDELLNGGPLSNAFLEKCRVLIIPCLNPDGVDNGQWRHSAGGVDLNRDWAEYRQPEVANAAKFIYQESRQNPVILGIDFHSTYHDVFYTNDTTSLYPDLKKVWFEYMESAIPDYKVNEKSSDVTRPVAKSWFFSAFGAEGITYEVGDDTPEDFIELKGRVAARGVMKAFLEEEGLK